MIHILTLSWNAEDKLTQLHDTLVPALAGLDWQWHIKSNGCKDNTVAVAKSWANTNVIAHPNNKQNFAQGCNLLFKEASPKDDDYIMLLNNDILFNDKHSIKKMLSIIQKDSSVGVVGARLKYTGTDLLQHAGVVFDPTYKTPMHFRAGQKSDPDAEKNREFQAITGAVCITKAEYYRNANTNKDGTFGIDPSFHWAFCDVDLTMSIKYHLKKRVVYCGGTDIWHEESASLKKNPTNKLFLTHNLQTFFTKWRGQYTIDKPIYTSDSKHNLYLV